jgi:hypothetical protein
MDILILANQPIEGRKLSTALNNIGYNADYVTDGKQANSYLGVCSPCLVIADIMANSIQELNTASPDNAYPDLLYFSSRYCSSLYGKISCMPHSITDTLDLDAVLDAACSNLKSKNTKSKP